MARGAWVIDVGERDFEREVLDRSDETPVVVDFWAPWCGPCRTLGPLLERLADEHRGAFVLAKVDVDQAPGLAAAFGVQGIPAVKGFRDGAIVAEFVGAQPEAVVRQFLARVLPSDTDRLVREARDLSPAEAEAALRKALERESRHPRALIELARRLGERGETAEALALLELVAGQGKIVDEAERLAASIRMRSDGAGDESALRRRIAADPNDLDARIALGRALAAHERYEDALAELLAAVQKDPAHDDAAARKAMVDLFSVLGHEHPLTDRFRTELAKALYR